MTKFEEEVKRPANGPLTELNNNMQEVFSQYRKMRQYADYLEYELKQKNEHIIKLENENSFMRDERTTFDSNGNSVEPIIPQQALPVVPECVAGAIESLPEHYSAFEAISLINAKVNELPEENEDWLPVYNWLCEGIGNQNIFALAFITGKYEVEKPQLFYLKNKLTTSYLILDTSTGYFEHWGSTEATGRYKSSFTQQEIGSMEIESYEQIEVEK
ncbi:Phage protein [Lactococcus lactis subsp. lactis]|uniref:Phage protein n=1 Tax=Lactococcus lactis subsp. lactis TaxID=1360 RepID=A0A0V8E0S8_LACLL|nr:DUF1642 domain-containing protein [Lactococcus lactis]KSU19456.1 Phage protein [Lactococcus lactis subsp. lactis]